MYFSHFLELFRVGVDQFVLIPDDGVSENAGVTEKGEVGHVFGAIKLGSVHLADLLGLEHLGLAVDGDGDLHTDGLPVSDLHLVLSETFEVAAIRALVGDPS